MALGDYRLCDVCSGKAVYDGTGNLRELEEEHPDRALVVAHRGCVSSPSPEYARSVQQAMAAADPETVMGSAHWPTTARTLYHEVQRLRAAQARLPVLHGGQDVEEHARSYNEGYTDAILHLLGGLSDEQRRVIVVRVKETLQRHLSGEAVDDLAREVTGSLLDWGQPVTADPWAEPQPADYPWDKENPPL